MNIVLTSVVSYSIRELPPWVDVGTSVAVTFQRTIKWCFPCLLVCVRRRCCCRRVCHIIVVGTGVVLSSTWLLSSLWCVYALCVSWTCQLYFDHPCDDMTGMEINTLNGYCRSHAINFPFIIELDTFEVALVNAVQHAGYRLRYRNMRPRRDNSTKTGWA